MLKPVDIIDHIGAAHIQSLVRVGPHAIRKAREVGRFPAGWYRVIKTECDRLGIECPMALFSFKYPASKEGDVE